MILDLVKHLFKTLFQKHLAANRCKYKDGEKVQSPSLFEIMFKIHLAVLSGEIYTQPALFTSSKLTVETPEQEVNYLQS